MFCLIHLQKEKDLELTARIGKELLAGNQTLEARVGLLEAELKSVNERYTQASYELLKKNDLIKILSNDADDTGYDDSECLKKFFFLFNHFLNIVVLCDQTMTRLRTKNIMASALVTCNRGSKILKTRTVVCAERPIDLQCKPTR